jgi:tRNA(Ile)-lysidine synthase
LLNLKIKWCEDKSNFDLKYKRNKLRFLLNEIEDKNLITKRILQTIKTFQEVKETLDLIITKTEKKILKKNNNEIILNREKFISLSEYFKKSILTKCIVQLSCSNYKPRLYQIENIINSITKKTDFKRTIMNLTISGRNNIIKIKKN